MKVVLDTNIILASVFRKSKFHKIIIDLFSSKFELHISSAILLEYEEKLSELIGKEATESFIKALILLPNVKFSEPLFDSNLLVDTDDNKFLDVYYSAQCDYLVTNDKDYNILHKIKTPVHNLLKAVDFLKIISKE